MGIMGISGDFFSSTAEEKIKMTQYQLYINGNWVDGDQWLPVVNPADGEVFAEVAAVDRKQVARALESAQASLEQWNALTALERGDFLLAIAGELAGRADHVARMITMENGKPLAQSQGEVAMSIDHLRWFAEEARRAYGRVVSPQARQKRHLVLKQPIGVVGAIAPWNFPLVLLARKMAPALAAGCPVVAKPASATPISAVELAKCVEAAGLPTGVFQLVNGQAAQIGAEMLENTICRKITFTGSTAVGKQLVKGAAETLTKLSLELGGNAPILVFADADFDTAINGVLMAKFRNTGQSCIAANRIYVHQTIYEHFLETFVSKIQKMKVGNGLQEGVEIGPVIDMQALENTLAYIDNATSKGARLLCGGRRWGDKGTFIEPTVLADVPDDAACMQEEIFAPVASVCAFETEAEAIEKANAYEYGLAAYAFTSDLNRFFRLAESLEAGTIGVNDGAPTMSNCPFGGFKQSGWGRELGTEGLDAFLETKHISIGGI